MIKMITFSFLFFVTDCVVAKEKSDFFKNTKTLIENVSDLRDPFKRKRIRLSKRKRSYGGFLKENKYSNLPTIGSTPLSNIRVIGVLLGKERRAIAKKLTGDTLGRETFLLKEGMRLGENRAEIKAILPGGIVLVEKILNVYDQEEYIETIIPVSSETN